MSGASRNGGRYLVSTTRGSLGLGNRMLAHASAYYYALLTNRTFVMHSADMDLEGLFSVPRAKYDPPSLIVDTSHDAKDGDWDTIICHDVSGYNSLMLSGGQYFIPLMVAFNHLLHPKQDNRYVFSTLAKYLFKPSHAVARIVDSYEQPKVGIQLRSFRQYMKQQKMAFDAQQSVLAWRCMKRHSLPADHVFLASLHKEHAVWLAEHGGSVKMNSAFERQDNSLEQGQAALAEMYILARAEHLILSPFSTFAYAVVGLRHEHKHVHVLDQGMACRRIDNMEPCFHRAPLLSNICKHAPRNASAVKACPDHRRGIKLA